MRVVMLVALFATIRFCHCLDDLIDTEPLPEGFYYRYSAELYRANEFYVFW